MLENAKECSICKTSKSLYEFYSQKKTRSDGTEYIYHNPECKECTKTRSWEWWNSQDVEIQRRINYKRSKKPKRMARERKIAREKRKNGDMRRYYSNNKDKFKKYAENRKHKNHIISQEEWMNCKKYFDDSCAYCGENYSEHLKKFNQDLHKEHVDDDGSNTLSNCVPSCKVCNSIKKNKDVMEWYTVQKFFSRERLEKINRWLEVDYKIFLNINSK